MKKTLGTIVFSFLILLAVISCSSHEKSFIKSGGSDVVSFRVLPFELTDIKLLDGPFLLATELNINTLLKYEPDRLLSKFYSEAGL